MRFIPPPPPRHRIVCIFELNTYLRKNGSMKLCLQQQELSVQKASCVSKSIPRVKQLETHLYSTRKFLYLGW